MAAHACAIVGLQIHGENKLSPGGPNVALNVTSVSTTYQCKYQLRPHGDFQGESPVRVAGDDLLVG